MNALDLLDVAAMWHDGQWSDLYSLISTGQVNGVEHKEGLISEIKHAIQVAADFADKDIPLLKGLLRFISTAPMHEPLVYMDVDHKGQFTG